MGQITKQGWTGETKASLALPAALVHGSGTATGVPKERGEGADIAILCPAHTWELLCCVNVRTGTPSPPWAPDAEQSKTKRSPKPISVFLSIARASVQVGG